MILSFSIDEACKITGLGRTKLYEAINKGLLPAKKYGKRTIIRREDLEGFLDGLESYGTERKLKNKSIVKKRKKSKN